MILYLHGFRSSPLSVKARLIGRRLQALGRAEQYLCPQLPASPKQAMELVLALVAAHKLPDPATQLAIIGSSLGGYYATWLAERFGCRAVLLNPAVAPLKALEQQVGLHSAYHSDQPFLFRPGYIGELDAFAIDRISRPERYFLLAASGDEVLDYRTMLAHYRGARQHVIEGSDHGISGFEEYVDQVLGFCGVPDLPR